MGTSPSKPLNLWTRDDVSKSLTGLGPKFADYADGTVENGVDGDLLATLNENELNETLDDLEINNRLHRRIIIKKLNDLKKIQSHIEDEREELEDLQEHAASSAHDSNFQDTDANTEDFNVFDDIILQALDQTSPNVIYAGIHLIRDEGQLVLAGSLRKDDKILPMPHLLLRPHEVSFCSMFVRETEDSYLEKTLPNTMWEFPMPPPNYSGYIVKDEQGNRLGSMCILDMDQGSDSTDEKQLLLRELAAEAERQIKERKALLEREASLQVQLQQAAPRTDSIVSHIKEFVLAEKTDESALGSRLKENTNAGSSIVFEKDSASELRFQSNRATGEDLSHLPANFHDFVDKAGAPHPPIAMDDMQSIAAVEELNLRAITAETKIGQKIKKLMSMACRMFDFPVGTLAFHDHILQHTVGTFVKDGKAQAFVEASFSIVERDNDGTPFLCFKDRGSSICNYPLFIKKTFVVQDLSKDRSFVWAYDAVGLRAYAGSPLIDSANRAIANLCLFDKRPRPDFDSHCEVQLEQISHMILQEIENWSMWNKIEILETERNRLLVANVSDKKSQPPKDEATIVLTDIEGSTSMWESDSNAMQAALDIHDRVMRDVAMKHNGYVIDTEGDAFFLAFHDPVDAVAFAIAVQLRLYEAEWQDSLLQLKPAKEEKGSFRGLRVRMGIHHGSVRCSKHEVSQRTEYAGLAWNLAKSLEAMSHGGQILTTLETWNLASSLGERMLGAYQVIDLGTHVLHKGKTWDEGVISMSVVQIVPESLSFDYFQARRSTTVEEEPIFEPESASTLMGRQFPPPITKRQVAPSFHDAPYVDNEATIMFLYTSEVEQKVENFETVRPSLVRLIWELLVDHGRGYHCHSFMIVFGCESDAIRFGLKYLRALRERESKSQEKDMVQLSKLVKFGCVHGRFSTMGPHKSSGRADYFGKAVNRAARVAGAAAPGTVYLGRAGSKAPEVGSDIHLTRVAIKPLKGVQEAIVLYECRPQAKLGRVA